LWTDLISCYGYFPAVVQYRRFAQIKRILIVHFAGNSTQFGSPNSTINFKPLH